MLCLLAEQMLNWGVRGGGERKDRGLMWKDVEGSNGQKKQEKIIQVFRSSLKVSSAEFVSVSIII